VLPADPVVDEFQPFGEWVVEDVLGLDVAVTDCPLVEVVEGLQQLLRDLLELQFGGEGETGEAGGVEQLHDQPASMLLQIQVQSLILDDVAVGQPFDQHEVGPDLRDVLVVEHERLHRVLQSTAFLPAPVHHPVRPFPQLRYYLVLLREHLGVLVRARSSPLLIVQTQSVAGAVLGEGLGLQAQLLLDHGFVFADQREVFERVPDAIDVGSAVGGGCVGGGLVGGVGSSGLFRVHT